MKRYWQLLIFLALSGNLTAMMASAEKGSAEPAPAAFAVLSEEGRTITLSNGDHFVYHFHPRPKFGTVVLKVEVFDAKGKVVKDLLLSAEYCMPGMTMPACPLQTLDQNKKGAYLMPVELSMPGDWEIKLFVHEAKKELFRGVIKVRV